MNSSSCVMPVTSSGKRRIRTAVRLVGAGLSVAVAAYAALAASSWYRYGSPQRAGAEEVDPLLDRFMSTYDVVERHHVRVLAPAEITLAAAREQDLLESPVTRAIFKTRELAFGSTPDERARRRALLPQVLSLGWGVLAEVPDREIVLGAATRPWDANPIFRALGPEYFAAFDEPDYVKIVWSLRADPLGTSRVHVPYGDPRGGHRRSRPAEVPTLLGSRFAGCRTHPANVAWPGENGRGKARSNGAENQPPAGPLTISTLPPRYRPRGWSSPDERNRDDGGHRDERERGAGDQPESARSKHQRDSGFQNRVRQDPCGDRQRRRVDDGVASDFSRHRQRQGIYVGQSQVTAAVVRTPASPNTSRAVLTRKMTS